MKKLLSILLTSLVSVLAYSQSVIFNFSVDGQTHSWHAPAKYVSSVLFANDTPEFSEPMFFEIPVHDTVVLEPTCPPIVAPDTVYQTIEIIKTVHDTVVTGQYDIALDIAAAYKACEEPWTLNPNITPNTLLENSYWTEQSIQAFIDARDNTRYYVELWIKNPGAIAPWEAADLADKAKSAAAGLTPKPEDARGKQIELLALRIQAVYNTPWTINKSLYTQINPADFTIKSFDAYTLALNNAADMVDRYRVKHDTTMTLDEIRATDKALDDAVKALEFKITAGFEPGYTLSDVVMSSDMVSYETVNKDVLFSAEQLNATFAENFKSFAGNAKKGVYQFLFADSTTSLKIQPNDYTLDGSVQNDTAYKSFSTFATFGGELVVWTFYQTQDVEIYYAKPGTQAVAFTKPHSDAVDYEAELEALSYLAIAWSTLDPADYTESNWNQLQAMMDHFTQLVMEAYDNLSNLTQADLNAIQAAADEVDKASADLRK